MTVHKAQGLTCDRAFTLGSDSLYREQGYVAMSRGRLCNHLYIVGPRPLDPDSAAHAPTRDRSADELLPAGLATSKAQNLAVDHLADPSLLTWTIGDLFAEQRRLRAVLVDAPEDRSHDVESLTRTRDALTRTSTSSVGAIDLVDTALGASAVVAPTQNSPSSTRSRPTSTQRFEMEDDLEPPRSTPHARPSSTSTPRGPPARPDRRHPQRPHRPRCLPGHQRPARLPHPHPRTAAPTASRLAAGSTPPPSSRPTA